MIDIIVSIIILAVLGAAIRSIVKVKKRGVKCIGCSAKGSCSHIRQASTDYGCGSSDKARSDEE